MDIQLDKKKEIEREREQGKKREETKRHRSPSELTEIGVHTGFIRTTNYWNGRRR